VTLKFAGKGESSPSPLLRFWIGLIGVKKEFDKLREFEAYMAGEKKSCENSCIFCFIDQLPKEGLRDSLYFKDDDERLSFLHGNYITLTNLDDGDIGRIIRLRISPVNISVHTTDPALRVKMMGSARAGEVLGYLKKLAEADIDINAQVVLCRGINDGHELEKTLGELCSIPAVQSISVVPAGLTRYRKQNRLFELLPFDGGECKKIIETVDRFGAENLKKRSSRVVYCADELYLKAGLEIPGDDYYEDYPQHENGVGMIRGFCEDFYRNVNHPSLRDTLFEKEGRAVSIVTGEAAFGVIQTLAGDLCARCQGLSCRVYGVKNNFFGEGVTVAGLVTGGDIISRLAPHRGELGSELLVPAVMLRYERDLFLDGIDTRELEEALGVKVAVVENNAEDFINKVTGCSI